MREIERAVFICGSGHALARGCGGKTAPSLVQHWLRKGKVPPHSASMVEAAVAAAILSDPEAFARAKRTNKRGGGVRVEKLSPDVRWERDAGGAVLGWFTPDPRAPRRARRHAPAPLHKPRPHASRKRAIAPTPARAAR
jgi:DNA-binding transcriptional regulator YdaS (Cro superfamily)